MEITQGNIDHNHIYLRTLFDKFPAEVIGGANHAEAAKRELAVHWGAGDIVMTDLDGKKKLFRKRGWIREFFSRNHTRPGDMVAIEQIDAYSYRLSMHKRA